MMGNLGEFSSVVSLFDDGVKRYPNSRLLNYKVLRGKWESLSSREAAEKIERIALGLFSRGIRFEDPVAILSENRPEWVLFDLAAQSLGAVVIPIYTTQTLSQIEFILKDSQPKLFAISTFSLYQRILPLLEKFGLAHSAVVFDKESWALGIMTLEDLEKLGKQIRQENPSFFQELKRRMKPDNLSTILYTMAETGQPKGVMLTHRNLIFNVLTTASLFPINPREDAAFSYLPLSHIFERTTLYHYLHRQVPVYFAESLEHLSENLKEIKPTIMTTVPRFLEKAEEKILAQGKQFSRTRRKFFDWAIKLAGRYDPENTAFFHKQTFHALADWLVFQKIRKELGGRLRLVISGGAALRPDVTRFFWAAGIPVLQGYGLTETSPVISVNLLKKHRLGSVGQSVPGVQVKIGEDGEILVKGPNVMKGYFHNEKADAAAFQEGWFRTGDVGYLDSDGFLFVTGRKKNLFKTSGGKYIAPQAIEELLGQNPYVEKAVVLGEGRKFPVALLFADISALNEFARKHKLLGSNVEAFVKNPMVRALYQEIVDGVNLRFAHWETLKRFAVISDPYPSELSDSSVAPPGKRSILEEKYRDVIESFYAHGGDSRDDS